MLGDDKRIDLKDVRRSRVDPSLIENSSVIKSDYKNGSNTFHSGISNDEIFTIHTFEHSNPNIKTRRLEHRIRVNGKWKIVNYKKDDPLFGMLIQRHYSCRSLEDDKGYTRDPAKRTLENTIYTIGISGNKNVLYVKYKKAYTDKETYIRRYKRTKSAPKFVFDCEFTAFKHIPIHESNFYANMTVNYDGSLVALPSHDSSQDTITIIHYDKTAINHLDVKLRQFYDKFDGLLAKSMQIDISNHKTDLGKDKLLVTCLFKNLANYFYSKTFLFDIITKDKIPNDTKLLCQTMEEITPKNSKENYANPVITGYANFASNSNIVFSISTIDNLDIMSSVQDSQVVVKVYHLNTNNKTKKVSMKLSETVSDSYCIGKSDVTFSNALIALKSRDSISLVDISSIALDPNDIRKFDVRGDLEGLGFDLRKILALKLDFSNDKALLKVLCTINHHDDQQLLVYDLDKKD